MAGLITDLIELLQAQSACYDDLLKLAHQKNEALVKNDLPVLGQIVANEQPLVSRVQRLEKKRAVLVNDIALVVNKKAAELNVAALLSLLIKQPKDRSTLEQTTAHLKETIENLRTINDKNSLLIQQSLDFVDYMMNFVQSSQSVQPPTYPSANTGTYANANSSRSLFDRKQ